MVSSCLPPQWRFCKCDKWRNLTHDPSVMSPHAKPLHHGTTKFYYPSLYNKKCRIWRKTRSFQIDWHIFFTTLFCKCILDERGPISAVSANHPSENPFMLLVSGNTRSYCSKRGWRQLHNKQVYIDERQVFNACCSI